MLEIQGKIIYSPTHALSFRSSKGFEEMLKRWKQKTGKEWDGEVKDGGEVVIWPKLSLTGEAPQKRGGQGSGRNI
jgi:hypothetical protein